MSPAKSRRGRKCIKVSCVAVADVTWHASEPLRILATVLAVFKHDVRAPPRCPVRPDQVPRSQTNTIRLGFAQRLAALESALFSRRIGATGHLWPLSRPNHRALPNVRCVGIRMPADPASGRQTSNGLQLWTQNNSSHMSVAHRAGAFAGNNKFGVVDAHAFGQITQHNRCLTARIIINDPLA